MFEANYRMASLKDILNKLKSINHSYTLKTLNSYEQAACNSVYDGHILTCVDTHQSEGEHSCEMKRHGYGRLILLVNTDLISNEDEGLCY